MALSDWSSTPTAFPNLLPTIDEPSLLSLYTPEPGHSLVAFSDQNFPAIAALVVRIRAPLNTGPASIKVALAGATNVSNWIAKDPAGVTSFSAITSATHTEAIEVVQLGDGSEPAWVAASDGLPGFGTAGQWTRIDMGDVNGDGYDDIAFGGESANCGQVFLYSPGGPWSAATSGMCGANLPNHSGPAIAFGSFNSDVDLDVAVDSYAYMGSPGGPWTLSPPTFGNLLPNAADVATADFNGDGFDDVVYAGGWWDAVFAAFSDGMGGWTDVSAGLPPPGTDDGHMVHVTDVNGDTIPDIVWTRIGAPGVWLSDGAGGWTEVTTPGLGSLEYWGVDGADLDGDNDHDLVFGVYDGGAGGGIRLYRQTTGGASPAWTHDPAAGLPATGVYLDVKLADLDGDGILDIIASRDAGPVHPFPGLEIWHGTGGGLFVQAPSTMTTGLPQGAVPPAHGIAVGDVNGDGVLDIGTASHFGVTVYMQNRPGLTSPCAAGTAGADLLTINGSAGGLTRRVEVGLGLPIVLSVGQPATNPNPANFVIFGAAGVPGPGDLFATPFGDLCLTPAPVSPADPTLFTLANVFEPSTGLVGATPAPWSLTQTAGLSFPAAFTLQGAIVVNNLPTNNLAITNGVILDVR